MGAVATLRCMVLASRHLHVLEQPRWTAALRASQQNPCPPFTRELQVCRHTQTRWPGPNLAAKLQGQSGPLHRVDPPFVSFKLHFLNFYNPGTLTRATHVLTEAAKIGLAEHTMSLSPRPGPSPTAGLTAPAHLWASLPPSTRTLCLRHTTHLHSISLMVGEGPGN